MTLKTRHHTQAIASLSDLLKASGIEQADLLELDESSLTELLGMAPLACRVPIGREIKAIKEVRPSLTPTKRLYRGDLR
jgi:hypothetical protein